MATRKLKYTIGDKIRFRSEETDRIISGTIVGYWTPDACPSRGVGLGVGWSDRSSEDAVPYPYVVKTTNKTHVYQLTGDGLIENDKAK